MKTIAIAGTFDTKGKEYFYVKGLIEKQGLAALTIHMGAFDPLFTPDISNAEVAAAAGYDITEIIRKRDRATATEAMAKGMKSLIPRLYQEGRFDGILSFGGSGGTSMVTPAMQALPIGVPKVMVSTMASGNVAQYVGTSDIVMMPAVVDVSGLNTISRTVYQNAVNAIAGMVKNRGGVEPEEDQKPLVAATMFGVTTPCVERAKSYLEEQGYEVLVFHATGTGGRTMENLIRAGFFTGVLDLTTTEWCDEVAGGVLTAGPHRCEAAALTGTPQVVSVGAADMVNFGPIDTVPDQYKGRNLYKHNPAVTLMRTTAEENIKVAGHIAEKLNMSIAPAALMLPLGGVSAIDAPGQPFRGPVEDKALFDTLKAQISSKKVEIVEMDCNINDEEFAVASAQKLIGLIEASKT